MILRLEGLKKNNFQSCKQERSSRDQVNPTCDILGSYSKTSRIDFIWPIGICVLLVGSYSKTMLVTCDISTCVALLTKPLTSADFLRVGWMSRKLLPLLLMFSTTCLRCELDVVGISLFQFMENGCTWRFSTSRLVLSHDEKSPFLVAKPGSLQFQWRTDLALAALQEPDAKSDGTSFLDLFWTLW